MRGQTPGDQAGGVSTGLDALCREIPPASGSTPPRRAPRPPPGLSFGLEAQAEHHFRRLDVPGMDGDQARPLAAASITVTSVCSTPFSNQSRHPKSLEACSALLRPGRMSLGSRSAGRAAGSRMGEHAAPRACRPRQPRLTRPWALFVPAAAACGCLGTVALPNRGCACA